MPSITAAEATRSIGPYEILETIARGTVASVFKVRHRETEELAAIKAVLPPLSRNAVLLKRFEQEFRVSNALSHTNLVRALEFGHYEEAVYLVMELVDGPNLADRIERDGPLSEAEAVRVIVEAARGLHHAHKHGIVHRDVKPKNVLLGAKGQVKLADLGQLKDLELDLGLTGPGESMGTPCFMAPEQFRDAKRASVLGDVYSLGATLYTAITGETPFAGRGVTAILKKKQTNDLAPPRRLVPTLSERVERAILKAVRADPDVRPRNCLELIELLTTDKASAKAALPSSPARDKRKKGPAVERRASVRYACDVNTACKRNASIHPTDEYQDVWEGAVRDLSATGAGLLLPRRFEVGAVLRLELQTGTGKTSKVDMRIDRVER
ncbi:MAG TPA: serine/threonine-protein kinase, partial [Gemmataceae bacterium]|nr:serine/threonine-protein kinase [Gemmataceae bacterium]